MLQRQISELLREGQLRTLLISGQEFLVAATALLPVEQLPMLTRDDMHRFRENNWWLTFRLIRSNGPNEFYVRVINTFRAGIYSNAAPE